ncbi:unnamed protein product [Allacma fusca]|uniref:Down syndrome cell adhesion molecule-like protein Dscam2 n=1 Tax=Allacma fusca TaxID=39272 RepID=A0A8J2PD05_9HEXA|nr:unnamed protein product [Allacma fusca]
MAQRLATNCTIEHRPGQQALPPRITPFFFPSSVQVHQRAQVVCALQEGDPHMTTLTWFKNSELISPSGDRETGKVKIIEVQRDVSLLIIDGADSSDNGNYTCAARSDIEGLLDSITAPLVVRVPPKWLIEPKDQLHVLSGDTLRTPCQATGFPVPTISWKKQMGNRAGNYHDISIQSPNVKSAMEDVLSDSNGTLYIRNANKANQGVYLCEASNGIGSGISKVVRVIVNAPVKIRDSEQNTTSRVRTNAVLQCHITGDNPIDVSWRRSHLETSLALDPRYYVQTVNSSNGGLLSELKINNVVREDNGRYICSVSNPFGKDHQSFWLLVKDVPEAPQDINLIAKGSRFVRLGWSLSPSQFGNSPIIQFSIKYVAAGGPESWLKGLEGSSTLAEISVPGSANSETISNLSPATTYHFSVIARNEIGSSGPSERLDVTTDGEPPSPPTNVQAMPLSSTEIKILWDHPASEVLGNFRGYYVGFRRHREEEQYQFSTVEVRGVSNYHGASSIANHVNNLQASPRTEYFLRNLLPFTAYEIVIQGYNVFGVGGFSEPVIVNTLEDVPASAPEGLVCTSINPFSLQVSFQALPKTQARGLLTGYKVYVERVELDKMDDEVIVRTTTATLIVISGLQPWTNYSIQVAGMTRVGEGALGTTVTCQTEEDVPGKLENVKSVVSSPTSIIVSWLPPKKKTGRLISYNLYYDASGSHTSGRSSGIKKKTITPTQTYYEVEGLKTNEKYEFRISAVTSKGEGKFSVTRQVPTKNYGAAIISIGSEVYAIWKTDVELPCKVVGDPVPTQEWTKLSKPVEDNDRISRNADGSLLIRDARKEDEGEYICEVANIRGSESVNHSVFVQVPPAAPSVQMASSTHNSISIIWKQMEGDKIAPVKGYILHLKVRDEWIEKRISRHLNTYEITDLDCGTRYQLYLTGYNTAGIGKASNMLKNVSTLGDVPRLVIPVPEMMLLINVTWIRVKLDSWDDSGCAISHCRVMYRPHEYQSRWQTVSADLSLKSKDVDIVGLKPSTHYAVRVSCQNSAGENEVDLNPRTLPHGVGDQQDSLNNSSVWKTAPAATVASTVFYLDWKLMGPIVLSSVAMILAGGGLCLCIKKKPQVMGRSMEHLSGGTPSSSTYFKGNQRSNSHQLYMTVKKATPVKGQDLVSMDHIPQYAEDIYPYATFELNEPPNRRESRFSLGATSTLDRGRTNSATGPNGKSNRIMGDKCGPKFNAHYNDSKTDESEEYDSIDSDSDIGTAKTRPGEFFIEYREPMESKCQDFEYPHARCGNKYEFAPVSNHMFHPRLKNVGRTKEKHRSSCDTSAPDFTEHTQFSKKQKNGLTAGLHPYGGAGVKGFNPSHIEPPSGFGDKCQNNGEPNQPTSTNEFAIAV